MNRYLAIAALFAAVGANATESPMGQGSAAPGTEARREMNLVGEVHEVNRVTKTITMEDADGDKVKIKVPQKVQDVEMIDKGARLNVQFTPATALAIGSPDERLAVETDDMRMAPGSGTGGETETAPRHLTGRINEIDRDKRLLKIEGPDKQELKLRVPPGTPGFDKAEEGDIAAVHYSEAVALRLQNQPAKE